MIIFKIGVHILKCKNYKMFKIWNENKILRIKIIDDENNNYIFEFICENINNIDRKILEKIYNKIIFEIIKYERESFIKNKESLMLINIDKLITNIFLEYKYNIELIYAI